MLGLSFLSWVNVFVLLIFLATNSLFRKALSDSKFGKLSSNLRIITMIAVIFVYSNQVTSPYVLFPMAILAVIFAPIVIWNICQYFIGAFSSDDDICEDEQPNTDNNDTSEETSSQQLDEVTCSNSIENDGCIDLDEGHASQEDFQKFGAAICSAISGKSDSETISQGRESAAKIMADYGTEEDEDVIDDCNTLGTVLALGYSSLVAIVYITPLYCSYSIVKHVVTEYIM